MKIYVLPTTTSVKPGAGSVLANKHLPIIVPGSGLLLTTAYPGVSELTNMSPGSAVPIT